MAEARPDRVLRRYSEVSAALRDPNLLIVGARPESQPEAGSPRAEIQAGLPAERISAWQERLEGLAHQIVDRLPSNRPLDLIAEFARPWGQAAAEMVTGVAATDRLTQLAAEVSSATADPYDAELRARAAAASSEMDAFFPGRIPPKDASTFVALSQTLVSLLANCWLPLVERPDEIERLAMNPDWMPRAVEEMLRVAGVPRMVFRRAPTGERLTLMLAAANRDPDQFPDPDRLDVSRTPAGQLSLGGWLHSCVGGPLIRMAIGVATATWVPRFAAADSSATVEWRGGPILRWPTALLIRLKSI
jgi:cytochrome P450